MFSGKSVLVTGATGLIGSHLVLALLKEGAKVFAVGRSEKKLRLCFSDVADNPRLTCVSADVCDEMPEVGEHIDFLFHAASPMEPGVVANSPVDVVTPNLRGSMNCLEFLRKQKDTTGASGRMVVFSSVTVYGNLSGKDLRVSESDTAITDCLHAKGAPYSQSKRMAEVIAQAYRKQYGIDIVIVRFSTVYGDTKFKPNTAFFEFLGKAVRNEEIQVNVNTAPRRDNIYIDDAVSGLLLATQKGEVGEAYNISSNAELGNFAAVDEIAHMIVQVKNEQKEEGQPQIAVVYRTKEMKPRAGGLILGNEKLKQLGWRVQTGLREGIQKTLVSYEKKGG